MHRYFATEPRAPAIATADVERRYADMVTALEELRKKEKEVPGVTDADGQWIQNMGEKLQRDERTSKQAINKINTLKKRADTLDPFLKARPSQWDHILHEKRPVAATKGFITEVCTWLARLIDTEYGDHVRETLRDQFNMDLRVKRRRRNEEVIKDTIHVRVPTTESEQGLSFTGLTHITQTQDDNRRRSNVDQQAESQQDLEQEPEPARPRARELQAIEQDAKNKDKKIEKLTAERDQARENLTKALIDQQSHRDLQASLRSEAQNLTTQADLLRTQLEEKAREIGALNQQIQELQAPSSQKSAEQYQHFQENTDVALQLFTPDLQGSEDDVLEFPAELISALNRHITLNTGTDAASYWTMLTTSEETPCNTKLSSEVEVIREMFRLFAMIDRPTDSYDKVRLSKTLQQLTQAVATRPSIAGEVAEIVCAKAHSILSAIQDAAVDDVDIYVVGLQVCQVLDIIQRRWTSLNIPLDNIRSCRNRNDMFGRLCRAVAEGNIRGICESHASPSPWLLCGNCVLMTEPEWEYIAYLGLDNQTIQVVHKSYCDDGNMLIAILYLSEDIRVEVDLQDAQGRIWWLMNILN